jgi:hypothetical protein
MIMCFVCCTAVFDDEERFLVDHTIHGLIKLCEPCGIAAERLGWWITV